MRRMGLGMKCRKKKKTKKKKKKKTIGRGVQQHIVHTNTHMHVQLGAYTR